MDSALSIGLGSSILHLKTPSLTTTLKPSINPPPFSSPSRLHFTISKIPSSNLPTGSHASVWASNSSLRNGDSFPNSVIRTLQTAAVSVVLTAVVAGKFQQFPARAETTPKTVTEEKIDPNQGQEKLEDPSTPLSQFFGLNSLVGESLKSLLWQELVDENDPDLLEIVKKCVSDEPEETWWKLLWARMLDEMGSTQEARDVFETILKGDPFNFEALFENALLMERRGEGNAVILRLGEALRIAEQDNKVKEAREVRLIMSQIQFLRKNVDEALRCYEELAREDPNDFRPYFCKGMIYSLLGRNKEALVEFAKYLKLLPKKSEMEGYLRSPMSRMKISDTNEED